MPIYEYRCENGHTFEVLQRMSDAPVATCETCEAPVQQVFHPIAVHFKGKGFYNTDYGTKNRQRETAAAGEGKGGEGKNEGKGGEGKGGEGKSGEGKSGEGKSEGSSDGKKGETTKANGGKKAESSSATSSSSSSSKSG